MNTKLLTSFFVVIFCISHLTSSSTAPSSEQPKRKLKILVYSPSLSWSHAQFLGKVADTLTEAGHEVHFLKYIMEPSLANKNETKLVKKIYRIEPRMEDAAVQDVTQIDWVLNPFNIQLPSFDLWHHVMDDFAPAMAGSCQEMIENTQLLNTLTAEHFDVGISEMHDICPMAMFHRIGVRTKVATFATRLFPHVGRRFGLPNFPSFMPNMCLPQGNPLESSFFERLLNFYNEVNDWLRTDHAVVNLQAPMIRRVFGPEFPELDEIARNVSMIFINSNPFTDMPRPISNKIVYIGGLADETKKQNASKLDKRTKKIMDNARDGAVLFSFGSITDTTQMSVQMRRAILRAFARFPSVQFLWKLDSLSAQNDSALFSAVPNVHTFQWIQQTAVLNHPNARAFISHCGLNSVGEASRAGVPVVAIPLFGDQPYNAIAIEFTGMAVRLNVLELNSEPNAEELMFGALDKILNEPKYRQNAKLIAQKLELMPFSPAEKLIRWVEFAAEFDNLNELNLPTGDEHFGGWFFYYSLDAISFTLAILVGLIWMAGKCLKFLMAIFPMAAELVNSIINVQKLKIK